MGRSSRGDRSRSCGLEREDWDGVDCRERARTPPSDPRPAMRIRDVRTPPLEYPLPQPVFDANYRMATKPALLVEVETDDGLIGLGEAAHFGGPLRSTQVVIEGELRDHLVGEDPRDIERLWEQMHQRAYKHARGGLLIAAMSGIY